MCNLIACHRARRAPAWSSARSTSRPPAPIRSPTPSSRWCTSRCSDVRTDPEAAEHAATLFDPSRCNATRGDDSPSNAKELIARTGAVYIGLEDRPERHTAKYPIHDSTVVMKSFSQPRPATPSCSKAPDLQTQGRPVRQIHRSRDCGSRQFHNRAGPAPQPPDLQSRSIEF